MMPEQYHDNLKTGNSYVDGLAKLNLPDGSHMVLYADDLLLF